VLQIQIDGKRTSLYGKTPGECLTKRDELRRGVARGVGTYAELADRWLAHGLENRKPRTVGAHEQRLRCHILPALGGRRLEKLTIVHVEDFKAALKRGHNPGGVRAILETLRASLAYGVKTGRVASNVARGVEVPAGEPREVAALTEREAQALAVALAADEFYGPLFITILGFGLRAGEAAGLRWSDIDPANEWLTVRQQVAWRRYEGWERLTPKGKKSGRVLPLPADALATFARQRLVRPEPQPKYRDWDLVFLSPTGQPLHRTVILQNLKRALRRAGLDARRTHDLRHHHAAILFAAGADPKFVQAQLGHARLGTTMDIYTSLLPGQRSDASARAWRYFSPAAAPDD